MIYDVIIIGSGPAGLTAAIYTTRDRLKTLVIAGVQWGGQLQLTTLVENFPGFPQGIQGPDLMLAMRKQAESFGAKIIEADFSKGNFSRPTSPASELAGGRAESPFKIIAGGKEYTGRSVIIATGTSTQWLGVPGEKEKIGHGVAACAPCDAPFFKNKNVIVVGGGNAAMEEALVLANFAKEVNIVYRQEAFKRASQVMLEKVRGNSRIKMICNSEIIEVLGENKVESVKLRDTKTNKISKMPIDGIFVAIRRTPNSEIFEGVKRDEEGYIETNGFIKTNVSGVFAAGDVHNRYYQQAIVAAGFGAMAALEVSRYLESLK